VESPLVQGLKTLVGEEVVSEMVVYLFMPYLIPKKSQAAFQTYRVQWGKINA
jgi:hypothetical protein